ncbi:MAG TPA: response regulator transcription factor [Actinomycetota bacterium]|nr:response regulator transcription factor [Actinomycetota bacterium]
MSVQDDQVRILLADEQSLFREAVRVVLESEPDLRVVAEARDGAQALAEAERLEPDVALVDAGLPNTDGLQATSEIRARVPGCRVLVLGTQEDDLLTLVGALESGATGYLTKECPLAELIDATRSVHRGETLVPPRMLGPLLSQLVHRRREQNEAVKLLEQLTRREKEVLALLADGAGNDRIAQELVISPETARTHIQNVLGKLGVHSRLEAAAFVVQNDVFDELIGARV